MTSDLKVKCGQCGWEGHPGKCAPTMSPYHDLRCAGCGSTDMDTTALLETIPDYCYGKHNCLQVGQKSKEDPSNDKPSDAVPSHQERCDPDVAGVD